MAVCRWFFQRATFFIPIPKGCFMNMIWLVAKNCDSASVCARDEESPKNSLVRRFGVSKDSFAYTICCALWPATNTKSITFTIGYLWYHTTLNIVSQYYSYYNISTHQKNTNLVKFGWMLEDRIFSRISQRNTTTLLENYWYPLIFLTYHLPQSLSILHSLYIHAMLHTYLPYV